MISLKALYRWWKWVGVIPLKISRKKSEFWGAIVGLRAQIIYWVLGLVREREWSEEERMVRKVQAQYLMSKIQMERLSEEEYLLEYDKYSSNMYSNDKSNLPWSSSDRGVHHEHTRKGTQKYLRESCYHHIEYTAATFLAAFMWIKPLNSVALATTIHKKPKMVSNEISTQIRA